jgi:hypothetical protein
MLDAELAGRFETDQDSNTVPGIPPEALSVKLMTAPLVPLRLLRGRLMLDKIEDVASTNGAAI